HLAPVHRRAVVELHALAELEDPRRRVLHLPVRDERLADHRRALHLGEGPHRFPLRQRVPYQRQLGAVARHRIEGTDDGGEVQHETPAADASMPSRATRPNLGPYSLLAHMPGMAHKLEALRIHLRDEASLPQKLQELVMISVARDMSCAFIWYAHAAAGRQAGVRDDIVDNIRERLPLTNLAPEEQT